MENFRCDTEESDPVTIADLEIYGLSKHSVEVLTSKLQLSYLEDLYSETEKTLLETEGVGETLVENLRFALRNYLAGVRVKTEHDCIFFE
jgi:hypothetical protein